MANEPSPVSMPRSFRGINHLKLACCSVQRRTISTPSLSVHSSTSLGPLHPGSQFIRKGVPP
ncbi:hypothetical protein V8C34DRAFT_266538 [Trichoderma compactum]